MPIGYVKNITGLWKAWHNKEIYKVRRIQFFQGMVCFAGGMLFGNHLYGKFYLLFWLLFLAASDSWLSNPSLPDDILKEAVPGSIRRAEHFLDVLKRLLDYLKHRLKAEKVESEGPTSFVMSLNTQTLIDQKTLKFCYDRLHSLLLTLEITDTDEFLHIQTVCNFATLVGTYSRGFSIIIEPFDERMPHIPDPVLQVGIFSRVCTG